MKCTEVVMLFCIIIFAHDIMKLYGNHTPDITE